MNDIEKYLKNLGVVALSLWISKLVTISIALYALLPVAFTIFLMARIVSLDFSFLQVWFAITAYYLIVNPKQ